MNIFEKGTRLGLRFQSSKGLVSIEDLWTLPDTTLDSIANALNNELSKSSFSLFDKSKPSNSQLELKMEILKHIANVKTLEKEASSLRAKKRQENENKLAQLEAAALKLSNDVLATQSLDDINKMILELKSEMN